MLDSPHVQQEEKMSCYKDTTTTQDISLKNERDTTSFPASDEKKSTQRPALTWLLHLTSAQTLFVPALTWLSVKSYLPSQCCHPSISLANSMLPTFQLIPPTPQSWVQPTHLTRPISWVQPTHLTRPICWVQPTHLTRPTCWVQPTYPTRPSHWIQPIHPTLPRH